MAEGKFKVGGAYMKEILITGWMGFIGSNLVAALLKNPTHALRL